MVQFIAEVSSNHHANLERCLRFIDMAASVGCDAIKFQLFRIEQLFAPEILVRSAEHRKRKQWELPETFLPKLAERCSMNKIQFACTPFYLEAVSQLQPYVNFYKVASYELLWDDLLVACARTGKPVFLSTGMASLPEIEHAVSVLRLHGCMTPFLFHCTSAYPTPPHEANLAAIETLRQAHHCPVGWSDHTVTPAVVHRAVHRWGAQGIEFHLDLDGQGEEYELGHCWLPERIGAVIKDVRQAHSVDGNGIKEPVASERADQDWRADPSDGLRPLKHLRSKWCS
ncbi:MAG: N-acetylneuraminate synthase family protein [Verrucomicrobiota bacterium]|nr:N-acetylneuraminate synthase family protein [Verrucomicrobiota bacterium]